MPISTLAISRRLKGKGFTESQAEGVAEELVEIVENSDLVTKDFLRAEIGELRAELKAEIRDSKIDMIKWLISLQFASLALTVGLIYFLLRH
jgi:hypothetical protein